MSSLGGSLVKNPPAIAVDTSWSLSQEDHLEKEMATHTSTLAWEIQWTEEALRLHSVESQKSQTQLSD